MTSGKGKCGEADCGHEFPLTAKHCPHCGRPGLFPNVRLAEDTEERQALVKRYDDAIEDAKNRGAIDNVQAFQTFVEGCGIVRSIPCSELVRLVRSDQELASTFYSLGSTNLDKGSHVLQGKAWDAIRTTAETALFGDDNKKQIH